MNTQAKLNERLAFSAPGEWVPMAQYRQFCAVGFVAETSPETEVTVQLRKATDAAGSGPANHGTAVTSNTKAVAQAYASELGEDGSGNAYTHVQATITGGGSPAADSSGVVIRGDGRFNP